ncbi:MAG: FAD-dependent oxidoreductase [Victivallales bacterium]|nr:FAD-dependent oxidoreductase [Victivallales bacterium]
MDIRLQLDIPVKYAADICIVGAGPGGIAAAVTAARRGHRVLLMESSAMPGGMSTAALVPMFMSLTDGIHFLCDGFGREIIYGLDSSGRSEIDHETLKLLYERLLSDSGAEVLYYSRLAAIRKENGRIAQGVFAGPSGLFAVTAEQFVDGTGDGTLAFLAGSPFDLGTPESGELMPASLLSLWTGYDFDAYLKGDAHNHRDPKMLQLLEDAFRNGELSQEDYHHTGIFPVTEFTAAANLGHVYQVNPTDEQSLSNAIRENRRLLQEYQAFYRNHIDGFAKARIIATASVLGIRESRRIRGQYTLTLQDYLNRASFQDEIERNNFPIDIHPPKGKAGVEAHKAQFGSTRFAKGESYGIPYRILLPQKQQNLLLCGRCVSAERPVYASIRVIPACYITGQAAGLAAALAIERHISPNDINRDELRTQLRRLGAFFH